MKNRNDIRVTDDVYDDDITKARQVFEDMKKENVEMRLIRSFDDYSKGYWIEFPPYTSLSNLDVMSDAFKPESHEVDS
jgi:hypothetical protein